MIYAPSKHLKLLRAIEQSRGIRRIKLLRSYLLLFRLEEEKGLSVKAISDALFSNGLEASGIPYRWATGKTTIRLNNFRKVAELAEMEAFDYFNPFFLVAGQEVRMKDQEALSLGQFDKFVTSTAPESLEFSRNFRYFGLAELALHIAKMRLAAKERKIDAFHNAGTQFCGLLATVVARTPELRCLRRAFYRIGVEEVSVYDAELVNFRFDYAHFEGLFIEALCESESKVYRDPKVIEFIKSRGRAGFELNKEFM